MIYLDFITAFIISLVAGMSTVIGSFIIFLNITNNNINRFITFCLSFSISIMIGISITDLIPISFFSIFYQYNFPFNITTTLLSFGIGIIIVLIINRFLDNNDSLYKLGILSIIAIIVHNFPEGIATFMGSLKDSSLGIKLSIAIMLHNIPEGISIAVPIYYATKSKIKAIFSTFISGIAEPLGALFTYIFLKNIITDLFLNIILLIVAGIMITLAIHSILPKALSYKQSKMLYLGIVTGIIIIVINHFIM